VGTTASQSLVAHVMASALQMTTSLIRLLHACAVALTSKPILHSMTITISKPRCCTAGVDEDGWPPDAPHRRAQQGASFCRPLAAPPGAPS
jgi:hypothetical protein